jgi:hypothetical protein
MSLNVCVVRLVSMVVYCLQLLIVCLQSSCDEHRGCVLLVVEWRRRVKSVCYFYTRAHTLNTKKKKKIPPVIRVVVVTRRSLHQQRKKRKGNHKPNQTKVRQKKITNNGKPYLQEAKKRMAMLDSNFKNQNRSIIKHSSALLCFLNKLFTTSLLS